MNEIKCPNCGKVFQIDESSYESIVKQIRDHEFLKEINEREKQYLNDKESAIKLAESKISEKLQEEINKLNLENNNLKNDLKLKDTENKLEIEKAISDKEKTINELENKIKLSNQENELDKKKTKENYDLLLKQKDETIEFYKEDDYLSFSYIVNGMNPYKKNVIMLIKHSVTLNLMKY